MKYFILVASLASLFSSSSHAYEADSLFANARQLYYKSVTDEDKIDPAIEAFTKIGEVDERLQGRTLTYIGSLMTLKAKFAFWPHEKWQLAWEGLRIMDKGLAHDPRDLESLFVHGVTCYYLPSFFGRADDAQRNLRQIVHLLPTTVYTYDPELVGHVVKFIAKNIRLNKEERKNLATISLKLAQK
jgi:hypothetical protein